MSRSGTPAGPIARHLAPLLLLLSLLPFRGSAAPPAPDPVASLPPPWDQQLVPIPESDISGAEPGVQKAITEARAEIARLLGSADSDRERLARAYGRLGALLVLREVEAPADAAFRNARTLEPRSFRWPYYAGYLAMMTGNVEHALELLEAARELDPSYPALYLRLGKVRLDRSELGEARAAFEHIAEVPGLESAAHFYLGQIANLERRYQDAVAHLTTTLEKDPAASEAQWPLAQAYRALGRDDLAREHMALVEPRTPPAKDPLLEQLQGAAEQSVPAFERAIYAVDKRDYKTAAAEFAGGLKVAPDNLAARVSYARVLYLDGDRAGAEAELDRVLAAQPDQTLALFLEAALAQQDGDNGRASALYRRVLEREPSHPGVLYFLANLDFNEDRWREAATGYRRALAAAEQAPPPAALLAIVAEHRSGSSDAESAQQIAALAGERPEDPSIGYARIRLLALSGDPEVRDPVRALELARYLALTQPGPQALRVLALAQAAAGDFGGAAATQTQCIQMAGGWLPPSIREAMAAELGAYQEGWLPDDSLGDPWPIGDPLMAPPPFDPTGPFRDYPASQPY